jgi:hypothetical protein
MPDPGKEPLLVAEAGLPYRTVVEGDPFEAWMDLMEVVEALCPQWPQWPQRAPSIGRDYRL